MECGVHMDAGEESLIQGPQSIVFNLGPVLDEQAKQAKTVRFGQDI